MTERTLILVKPDGVARGLVGEVLSRLEAKGLRLVAAELRTLTRDIAEQHYAEHSEKPFFGSLVEFITSAPLVALVLEGPNAIANVRAMNGATRPNEAARAVPVVGNGPGPSAAPNESVAPGSVGPAQSVAPGNEPSFAPVP